MNIVLKSLFLLTALLSVGCASVQKPIAVEDGLYTKANKVVVVMEPIPDPTTHFPGADCLLCMATAEGLHMTLGDHAETLDGAEFKLSKSELAGHLKEKGVDAIVLDDPLVVKDLPKIKAEGENAVPRDFSEVASPHDGTHVLVISVSRIGISRAFASYVPTEDPVAIVEGIGYLIDVRDNTYDWYQPFKVVKGVEGEWDQPPDFPKLTNAFYQVLAEARDEILGNF